MKLRTIDKEFSICKLKDYSKINFDAEYCFISKTSEENSLLCLKEDAPMDALQIQDGYRGFYIDGILDFSLIGIIAKIAAILAQYKIPVIVESTYNTDYIFVSNDNYKKALKCLSDEGYQIIKQKD